MTAEQPVFHLRFADIASNPHIRALHRSLTQLIPDAVWWVTDPDVGRLPFPGGRKIPCCDNREQDEALRQRLLDTAIRLQQEVVAGGEPPTAPCCDGFSQGIAPFFYRGQFVGGIGVCHVPADQHHVLIEVLKLVQGYLDLLGNYLEDNDDLELVHSIWSETISVLDLELLLERVSEELLRTVGREHGAILLLDDDGEFFNGHLAGFDLNTPEVPPIKVSRYDYATRMRRYQECVNLLETDDPLSMWFSDVDRSAANKQDGEAQNRVLNDDGVILIPFIRNDLFVGALICPGPLPDLSHGRQRLLELVAVGAATALDNATIFQRMNQRQLALTTIHTVHRLMTAARSLQDLLPRIGQLATQLMKAKKCSLMMMTPDGEHLRPEVCINLEPKEVGTQPLRRGQGLPGWVADNFNPVIYFPQQEGSAMWENDGMHYPHSCYLSVPLIEEDVRAVITVSRDKGRFTPGDREILMTYAEQALIAIQNAEAHQSERDITMRTLRSVANLLESHDPAADGLTYRISELAGDLALALNLEEEEARDITYAALLMNASQLRNVAADSGVGVSGEHRLEDLAFSQSLVRHLNLSDAASQAIYHLREKWDGRGVPDGLEGDRIPIGSRILAVAEAYVIMLHSSADLRVARSPQRALDILHRLAGRSYDPMVIKVLERVIRSSEGYTEASL